MDMLKSGITSIFSLAEFKELLSIFSNWNKKQSLSQCQTGYIFTSEWCFHPTLSQYSYCTLLFSLIDLVVIFNGLLCFQLLFYNILVRVSLHFKPYLINISKFFWSMLQCEKQVITRIRNTQTIPETYFLDSAKNVEKGSRKWSTWLDVSWNKFNFYECWCTSTQIAHLWYLQDVTKSKN